MFSKKITKIVGVLGVIIPFILSVIKEALPKRGELFNTLFWITLGFGLTVFVVCCVLLIVTYFKERRNAKNLADTTSILKRSRRIAKDLKKVVKKIDRTIAKHIRKDEESGLLGKKDLDSAKKNIRLIAGLRVKKVKRVLQNLSYFDDIKGRTLRRGINDSDLTDAKLNELNQAVLDAVGEMNRALLVLEQYDTRIMLGDYVLEHSSNVFDCADALIDYKGWTYSLLGRTSKFEESINKGIELLEKFSKDEAKDSKDYIKAQFKLARAKRHLGSDIVSTKNAPEKAIEYNDEASKILNSVYKNGVIKNTEEEYVAFLGKAKSMSPDEVSEIKKVNEMNVGIIYGKLNANYYILSNKKYKEKSKDLVKDVCELLKEVRTIKEIAKHFDNKHRYVKIVLLENEFIKLVEKHGDIEGCKESEDMLKEMFGKEEDLSKSLLKVFSANTDIVDKIFSKAIYADEIMEIYIRQEVDELYKNIKEIVK